MGFKCPVCLKDFLRNRTAWREHIEVEHNGIGKDVEKFIRKVTAVPLESVEGGEKQPTNKVQKSCAVSILARE